MKLRDVISELKNHEGALTPDEQERLNEIYTRLFELSYDLERVPPDQRELVDELIRNVDDLGYAVYGLAAAVEGR